MVTAWPLRVFCILCQITEEERVALEAQLKALDIEVRPLPLPADIVILRNRRTGEQPDTGKRRRQHEQSAEAA